MQLITSSLRQEDPRRGSLNVAHREPASGAKTGVTVGIWANRVRTLERECLSPLITNSLRHTPSGVRNLNLHLPTVTPVFALLAGSRWATFRNPLRGFYYRKQFTTNYIRIKKPS